MIGVVLGVLAAIFLFILYDRRTPEEAPLTETETPVGPAIVEAPTVFSTPEDAPVAGPEASEETYVRQLAVIFVERFQSFSNQNDNTHIEDAIALSTPRMTAWLRGQIQAQHEAYAGQTTTVVASSVKEFAPPRAVVAIEVQMDVSGEAAAKYRSGQVELLKDGETWKVDALYWET